MVRLLVAAHRLLMLATFTARATTILDEVASATFHRQIHAAEVATVAIHSAGEVEEDCSSLDVHSLLVVASVDCLHIFLHVAWWPGLHELRRALCAGHLTAIWTRSGPHFSCQYMRD